MQTIRSFIAIPLPASVRQAAVRLIRRLQVPGDGIRWVPTDNLHLTLKFLGEVDNVQVPEICQLIEGLCRDRDPFPLVFAGAGGFPDLQRARVLYAGIDDPSSSLVNLVNTLESELAELGFKPEPRDYRPHLTLGRTRSGSRRAGPDVISRLAAEANVALGEMDVDTVQMIASFLDKHGPTYQVMDTIELG